MLRNRPRRRSFQGWETCLRMFVCLLFMFVASLGSLALSGTAETEERAEAACEYLLEIAIGTRVENREDCFAEARTVSYLRFVRRAGHRLAHHGRGRIRRCETAPLPLRC